MAKNVALRLDEAVLRKARHAAVEEDKSLSEWVAGLITHVTSRKDRYLSSREKALKTMEQGFHLGGKPLSRGEAHER